MEKQKKFLGLHIVNALLFIILFLIQYNASFSINISSASPILPLTLLVVVCMVYSELRGAITGLMVGIFIDSVSSTPQGFNAIAFCILGLISVLTVKHLFNNNILSAISLCAICSFIYFVIRWIFTYAFYVSFTENMEYLITTAVPSCIYTAVLVIPFYYLEKYIYKKSEK